MRELEDPLGNSAALNTAEALSPVLAIRLQYGRELKQPKRLAFYNYNAHAAGGGPFIFAFLSLPGFDILSAIGWSENNTEGGGC